MKHQQVMNLLNSIIQRTLKTGESKLVLHLEGAPSSVKTEAVRKAAKINNIPLIEFRLSQHEAIELTGLPYRTKDGETDWARPSWLPKTGPCLLMFDEYMESDRANRNVVNQLITDHRLGDHSIPKNIVIILASNRIADKAGVSSEMGSLTANRVIHIEVEPDTTYFSSTYIKEQDWHPMLRGFLSQHPQYSHRFKPETKAKAWPSFRTWSYVNELLQLGLSDEDLTCAMNGAVGSEATNTFQIFKLKMQEMPPLEQCYAEPSTVRLPQSQGGMLVLGQSLAENADTQQRVDATIVIATRMPNETGASIIQRLQENQKNLVQSSGEFVKWAMKNMTNFTKESA